MVEFVDRGRTGVYRCAAGGCVARVVRLGFRRERSAWG